MSKQIIQDKTVWITGASSGIGYELALQLAAKGNFVIASARSEDKLASLVQQFPQRIVALPTDISKGNERHLLSDKLNEITDTIDILVACAGVVGYEDNLKFSDDMYQQVFAANFFGVVNAVAVATPFLAKSQQRAYIVGVSSMSMMLAFPRAQAYGASKAAADYFLHTLCIDLPKREYDVSIVRPGFIKTPMTAENDFPMPFMLSAQEAARRMIVGMEKRQRLIEFPRRLSWLIRLISWFPSLWYGLLGPKASRNQL